MNCLIQVRSLPWSSVSPIEYAVAQLQLPTGLGGAGNLREKRGANTDQ